MGSPGNPGAVRGVPSVHQRFFSACSDVAPTTKESRRPWGSAGNGEESPPPQLMFETNQLAVNTSGIPRWGARWLLQGG